MASTLPALPALLVSRIIGFKPASFTSMFFAAAVTLALSLLVTPPWADLKIVHQVPEGHIGVYWRGGALLNTTTRPGHRVVHRLHEDFVIETLRNYGLGYDDRWILDKIHREVNEFCTSHSLQQVYVDLFDQIDDELRDALQVDCTRYAPGIEIISVRVTKPTIPERIRWRFEDIELKRIELSQDGRDTDDQKQSTADLTVLVQNLVQMQSRFQMMSDSVIAKLGEMGSLIDGLEQSISDLRAEMGQKHCPPSAAPKPKEELKEES